ncbi:MAG: 30S ribosomal protein S20 [bacterium]|nr:30S ribosomal protein S20 [bacterium]
MPVIKSAEKKLRQAQTKTLRNRSVKVTMRESINKFRKNPAQKLFSEVTSLLDKAAKTNVIHKNKAARLKSRLSKLLPKTSIPKTPKKKSLTNSV